MVVKRAKADPDGIIAARLPGTAGRHATPVAPRIPSPSNVARLGSPASTLLFSQKVGERQ
jgi:hypothetical protein